MRPTSRRSRTTTRSRSGSLTWSSGAHLSGKRWARRAATRTSGSGSLPGRQQGVVPQGSPGAIVQGEAPQGSPSAIIESPQGGPGGSALPTLQILPQHGPEVVFQGEVPQEGP